MYSLTYMSPFTIMFYHDPTNTNANKCIQYSTTLTFIYLTSRVVLYYFLIPILLAIFGSLTIYNVRSQTRHVALVNQTNFTPAGITYILVTSISSMNTPYYMICKCCLFVQNKLFEFNPLG
jgi:hypothetical protein